LATVVHIAQATGSASLHFPFEELIAHLKKEGFVIKPDDYIELLKVTGTFGSEDIRTLRYRLAPLVCTSEQDQERFYKVFDAYAERTAAFDDAAAKTRKRKRIIFYSCAAALLLIIAGWIIWKATLPPLRPSAQFTMLVNGQPGNVALPTDTVIVEAVDPGKAQIEWNIGKGWAYAGLNSFPLSPLQRGVMTVRMRVMTGKLSAVTEQQLFVCDAVVEQLEADNVSDLQPGSEVAIRPVVRGNAGITQGALWVINGADTIRNQADQLQYRIDSAGSYQVDYVLASNQNNCNLYSPMAFYVDPPSPLRIASIGTPPTPPSFINPWLYTLLLVPFAGGLWQYLKSRRKKKIISVTDTNFISAEKEVPPGRVDIPLENNEMELIAREPEMNTFFRGMRKRIEDDSQVLDIKRSIKSEILAGGLPSLVFSQRTKQLEFLLLVDRPASTSQQLALFDYLVNLLVEENVNVERFYFTDFTRFTNAAHPLGISLQRLSELYKHHVMVVLGTGHQLLYPHLPALETEKMKLIGEWEMRSILTPVAYGDWGPREQALSKEFVVMPADIQGQLLLVQAITEKQFQQQDHFRTLAGNYSTGNRRYQKISQIKEYLGDEFLFQWLCAIAVYPKLRWEMMVEIGRALAEARGNLQAVNFTRLLKLVRLPWMKDGFIPEATRLGLLKELSRENEVIARKTVLDVLSRIDLAYKDDEYFQEEKRIQELTNKYLLYNYDPGSYDHFENEAKAFGQRWIKGKVYDGPLVRYLDKKQGDDWNNLLDKTPAANLGGYHGGPVPRRRFPTVYTAMGVLTAAILALLFFGKPWLEKLQWGNVKFVHADSTASQVFNFTFATDTCAVQGSDELTGSVAFDQRTVPLVFQSANRATLTAPFHDVAGRPALVEVSWGDNKTASRQMVLAATNELVLTRCEPIAPKPAFEILYNDPGKQDSVQLLSELLSSTFNVQAKVDSSVNASMLLINDSGSNASPEIQQWVSDLFGQQVKVTGSIAGSASVLRLYFERTPEWSAIPPVSLPSALNEIWNSRSGRFITWNTRDRLLWMGEKSPSNYTTYTIQNAYSKNGVYKVVVSANGETRVLFVQSVSRSGFQFCILPGRYTAAEVAPLDESSCTATDAAREYYTTASANVSQQREIMRRFYFPLAPTSFLNTSQSNQLQKQQGSMGRLYRPEVSYAHNSFFDKYPSMRIDAAKRVQPVYKMVPLERSTDITVERFQGTPFDRDYLAVSWTQSPLSVQQPDYNNAPVQEQKNVQQSSKEPVSNEEWQFFTRITVNPRSLEVKNVNSSEMKVLYDQLYTTAEAKIKIVSYYNTPAEEKEAYAMNESVRAFLDKNYGISDTLGSGKVTTLVRQKRGDGIEQIIRVSMRDQTAPQEKYVDIYGTNIRPPSKKY
jgi:hypothetical protein